MKEISLKKVMKNSKVEEIPELPKETYPSFSIYENAPEELMKCPMGCEFTAKIKLTSKEDKQGKNSRKSVGFDVISITVDDSKAKKLHKENATEYME